jgi:hypothetical protein
MSYENDIVDLVEILQGQNDNHQVGRKYCYKENSGIKSAER